MRTQEKGIPTSNSFEHMHHITGNLRNPICTASPKSRAWGSLHQNEARKPSGINVSASHCHSSQEARQNAAASRGCLCRAFYTPQDYASHKIEREFRNYPGGHAVRQVGVLMDRHDILQLAC